MKETYKMILKIVLILSITFILARYYKNLFLNRYMKGETNLILKEVSSVIYYGIVFFGILISLIQIGIQKDTLLTMLATVGFTSGLALQTPLQRAVSAIYIMLENLYQIGDYIDTGNTKGYVKEFSFMNTILYDDSNDINIVVPNNMIDSNTLVNYSKDRLTSKT